MAKMVKIGPQTEFRRLQKKYKPFVYYSMEIFILNHMVDTSRSSEVKYDLTHDTLMKIAYMAAQSNMVA